LNRALVELTRYPWHPSPMARVKCADCPKTSPWCDEEHELILWLIFHQDECPGWRRKRLARHE
jgi:hypothetical protein